MSKYIPDPKPNSTNTSTKGGGDIGIVPIIILLFALAIALFSCSRKLHTEKTIDKSSDTRAINVDSVIEVNKTLSEAYEELLKTTNSTGVVFESVPCDTVTKVAGATMPRINRVIISPDGTKTFEGAIKSYKDDISTYQRTILSLHSTIDSLARLIRSDTSHHEQSHIETIKTVKSTFIPVWMWVILAIVGLLWINERFSVFRIPLITRTSLFTKK